MEKPKRLPWIAFRDLETVFWIAFFVLLFVSKCSGVGGLRYMPLPNEDYDNDRHQLISSHEVCREHYEQESCWDMPDMWRDRRTGIVYTRDQFAEHRETEFYRVPLVHFAYGLIGCLGYAFFRAMRDGTFGTWPARGEFWNHFSHPKFYAAFSQALIVDTAVNVIFLVHEYLFPLPT